MKIFFLWNKKSDQNKKNYRVKVKFIKWKRFFYPMKKLSSNENIFFNKKNKFFSNVKRVLLIPGTGNEERGTGNGEPGTGVWERVHSGNPYKNSKWRTKTQKQSEKLCSLLIKVNA